MKACMHDSLEQALAVPLPCGRHNTSFPASLLASSLSHNLVRLPHCSCPCQHTIFNCNICDATHMLDLPMFTHAAALLFRSLTGWRVGV
jgi:hypothetical protein